MKYKVGDRARVRRDLNVNLDCDPIVVEEMLCKAGDIVTISVVSNNSYRIAGCRYFWTDEMFEGLVEDELTAEEAIILRAKMCKKTLCSECRFGKRNNGEGIECCDFSQKYPERVIEILKQWKKEHEKKEVETEFTWCVLIIEADTHTLKHEEKVGTDFKSMDAQKAEILKKYCSEHDGKYYAISERRCVVNEQS